MKMIVIAGVALFAGIGALFYGRQYYLSMRDSKPVLELLERGTPADLDGAFNALLDGPRLKGLGASKVRQAVLKALATATDGERCFHLFRVILAGQEDGRLAFRGKTEWDIIRTATERYGMMPVRNLRWFVTADTNGMPMLTGGMEHPIGY